MADFISRILLGDLRRLVYDANVHYLAFGTIAAGVEFLGACDDLHPFHAKGYSTPRFSAGMKRLARFDSRYETYNDPKSPHCLYKFLRCGTAHVLRPSGPVMFSQRSQWSARPNSHLEVFDGTLLLICEDFYDHFAQACSALIEDIPKLPAAKLQEPYLHVGKVQ